MRILLTGALGQLGTDLREVLADRDLVPIDLADLDLTDQQAVASFVASTKPDVVLNTAAFTDVDGCESAEPAAHAVNADAPRFLAEAVRQHGGRVIQISTDYVFDGTLDRPYRSDDTPNPASAYGRTKLAGERAMGSQDLVVRTSWLCGLHGKNLLKTVVGLAGNDTAMKFVDDQVGHPTFSDDLARVLRDLIDAGATGIVHATNAGPVSWYEFVQEVLRAMGKPVELVAPISTGELDPPRPAPRPANSCLDNHALADWGVAAAPDFRTRLPDLVSQLAG